MAAPKGNRPRTTFVRQTAIQQVEALLNSLPEKLQAQVSVRAAVNQLKDQLQAALARGYSYADLATMLVEQGIQITPTTLKTYLPSGRRRLKAETSRRPRQDKASKVAAIVAPMAALTAVPVAEPVSVTTPDPSSEPASTSTPEAKTKAGKKATPRGRQKKA